MVLWGIGLVVFAAIPFWYLDYSRAPQRVSGVLIDVQAASLVYADQVTLRDAEGKSWTFQVDPEVSTNREDPQTASHLRQHMVVADPVTVRYRVTQGRQVAFRITDGQ